MCFLRTLLPLLYWAGVSNFILIAILVPIFIALGALLGTAQFLIASALGAALLFFFRENRFAVALAFGIALAIGLSVQIMYEHMHVYQQKRITTFLNPESDQLGAGYNVVQSKIAIGSGGFTGKGFLKGTQTQLNYIPEQWTDFIFCVLGEEFGFLGASIVLSLFAALSLHGLRVANMSKNKFGSFISYRYYRHSHHTYSHKHRYGNGIDAGDWASASFFKLRRLRTYREFDGGRFVDELLCE